MSFIIYRRPRAPSMRETKQAISFDRHYSKAVSPPIQPKTGSLLLAFEDLPEWHQDNPFVRANYRAVCNSYGMCFRSCTQIHNETMNILTHMLPAITLILGEYTIQQAITLYYPEASMADRIVFALNLAAAIVTFSFSTLYHTFMCHSHTVSRLWLRIDYAGILVLILGSFFSGIYVGFYCESTIRNAYWSMITVLSLITAVLVLHPDLQGHKFRAHKAYAFVATAMTGFAPIGHGLYLYGWDEMWTRSGMPYWFAEGLIYALGAFFFIARFPECKWSGSFDVYFNSHSIFHSLVVCASFLHMYGVWSAYDWNYSNSRTCSVML